MSKIKKSVIVIELLILLIVCIYFVFVYFSNKKDNIEFIKEIKEYEYYLKNTDTELFAKYFDELYIELNNENIDYNNYAELITKLFVIDFYTLENKKDNKDIGGIQFLHYDLVDNFKLKASDTIYKYLLPNYDNKRDQVLPVVSNIEVVDIIDNYEITLSWEYEKDLGYETQGTFILIRENNKLYITEKK